MVRSPAVAGGSDEDPDESPPSSSDAGSVFPGDFRGPFRRRACRGLRLFTKLRHTVNTFASTLRTGKSSGLTY
jgi:hypothetical protein